VRNLIKADETPKRIRHNVYFLKIPANEEQICKNIANTMADYEEI
jgi:hypothetical protein